MKRIRTDSARDYLERAYGPGRTEEIICRLALGFWKETTLNLNRNGKGRVVSGRLLLEWSKLAGIKKIVPARSNQKAHITPCEDGFKLTIRVPNRKIKHCKDPIRAGLELDPGIRWDLSHELGHTFFYDTSSNPPDKTYGADESGEEALCQKFAAELLMPRERVMAFVSSARDVTLESLLHLAASYGVPLRAVLRRITHDLQILRGACVIIQRRVVGSWNQRRVSKKPFPKSAIEKFAPNKAAFEVTDEQLRADKVVNKVCLSGGYWNSDFLGQASKNAVFVEGTVLTEIAPTGGGVFVFHQERPNFKERLLFDSLER